MAYPEYAYLTLGTGISQLTSNFNGLNFSSIEKSEDEGTGTPFQIVPHVDDAGLTHSLLFFTDAAMEYDLTDIGAGPNFGIDYVAKTVSMVTQCTFVTKECGIQSTNTSNTSDISIPYNCYEDFSGDLGQTPSTGHERAQGWNMSFQEPIDGTPKNLPVRGQHNPFHFYMATAVNTIDISFVHDPTSNFSERFPDNASLVDGGRGFTAFALSCEATIYDVTFSLVNGSFHDFNTTKSSPAKASIIKAPLQVGFGQYHLFQAASLAVIATNDSVANTMAKAFSQTGMALASGVFDLDSAVKQRLRWTAYVTKVPKAPFFYLVVVCLLYSVFGMVMTVVALHLRRKPELRDHQAGLMVEWGPEILESGHQAGEDEGGEKKDGVWNVVSNEITDAPP